MLTLRGEKNSTQLASLARAVYLADQLGMEAAAQNDLKPTRGEIISFIDQTPQLADVLAASRAFRSQSGDMLTSSMFASLWWTFAHIDTDAADRFFMSLASGANLQADDPHTAQHVDGSASQGRPFHPRQPCTHRRIDHQGVEQVA